MKPNGHAEGHRILGQIQDYIEKWKSKGNMRTKS